MMPFIYGGKRFRQRSKEMNLGVVESEWLASINNVKEDTKHMIPRGYKIPLQINTFYGKKYSRNIKKFYK